MNYDDVSTITVFIIILRGIMFETKRPCLTTELSETEIVGNNCFWQGKGQYSTSQLYCKLFQPALCKKSHAHLSPCIWFLVKLIDLTFNPLAQYFLSASSKISILVHLGKWKKVLLKEWVVHRDFLPETTVQKERGGKKKFTWRNLTNYLSCMIKVNINSKTLL